MCLEAKQDIQRLRQEKHPGLRQRILVVDDNVDSAKSLAMLLNRWGYDVEIAHDGETALGLARLRSPHVVLLDIGLPGMDGYQVALHLRKQRPDSAPLLVALTGHGHDEDRQRTREGGFAEHFVKPVDPDVLEEWLAQSEWVGDRKPSTPPAVTNQVAA